MPINAIVDPDQMLERLNFAASLNELTDAPCSSWLCRDNETTDLAKGGARNYENDKDYEPRGRNA
jgi:hypothetical protein